MELNIDLSQPIVQVLELIRTGSSSDRPKAQLAVSLCRGFEFNYLQVSLRPVATASGSDMSFAQRVLHIG